MTKRKAPMTLHCKRCKYVTHSGISAMRKHYFKEHPQSMKRHKKPPNKSNPSKKYSNAELMRKLKELFK